MQAWDVDYGMEVDEGTVTEICRIMHLFCGDSIASV